jgi:hypothetical protein
MKGKNQNKARKARGKPWMKTKRKKELYESTL